MVLKKQKQTKGAGTKAKIVKKAMQLVTKKGLDQVSVREVARACKISSATAFYHFPTKETLILEIINNVVLGNHETVSKLMTIYDNAFEKLHKHIQGNLLWAKDKPEQAQILLLLYYMGGVHSDFSIIYKSLLFKARERIKEHLLSGKREDIFFFTASEDLVAEYIHNTLVGAVVNSTASQTETRMTENDWQFFLKSVTHFQNKKD